jgi:hypothetical protein
MNYPMSILILATFPLLLAGGAPQQGQTAYSFDCAKLSYPSEGCKSYNEMVAKNDSDVMSSIKSASIAYVCFVPDDDEFLITTFGRPEEASYTPKTMNLNILEASDLFSYSDFKNGVIERADATFGKWTKIKNFSMNPSFEGKSGSETNVSISDAEVYYETRFQNLNGTTTTYTLQIRRSTLRFSESFKWPQLAEDRKGTKAPTKAADQFTINGYCTEFQ